jgi:hypothetical protein
VPFPIQPLRNLSENIVGMPETIEVSRFIETTDEFGRPIQTWSTVHTTKGRYRTAGATELELAGRLDVDVTGVITLPLAHGTPEGLKRQDRLNRVEANKTYEVTGLLEATPELSPHLTVLVSEMEAGSGT